MLYLTNSWDWDYLRRTGHCETSSLDKSYSAVDSPLSAVYHRCLTPVRCQFSLCVFVFLLSSRYRNSQSCFYTTSKLWKLEEFEVKYVRAAYHYYYWQRVFIWSKSPQTKLHSWTLHSQLVLIRTSQARSYLGQHYNKAFISYNFIIWG